MIRLRSRLAIAALLALGLSGSGLLLQAQLLQEVGTWAAAGVGNARSNAATVVLSDGRTLIAGGRLADGTETDSVVIYDPISGSTTSAGQLLIPRVGAAAAMLNDTSVVIIGGSMGDALTADVELLNLATGTSMLVGAMAEPRVNSAAARLPSGRVLIVGGSTVGGAALATAEIFDPTTYGVAPAGSLTTPRIGASATTLIDGRVLIAGGRNAATTTELRSAEIYDSVAPSAFSVLPTQMSAGRAGHTAVLLPHNAGVLIAGGTSSDSPVASSDLFLPAIFPDPFSYGVGSFTATGAMNAARANAVSGPAGHNGYAFATGGGSTAREFYRYATIKTDKDDYAPGERALITGSGWQPNEEVHLLFQEDPAVHDDYELTVVADGAGNIRWDRWAPEQHDLNVRFYLMAQGAVSRAQTTFTDAELITAELTGTTNDVTVTQGSSANFTISLSANGNISCTVLSTAPATATVRTVYSIAANGSVSSSTPSSAFNFFAGTPQGGGGNCNVTWGTGTTPPPPPYSAAASVSVDAATQVGLYTVTLSANAGTTVVTSPNATGGKLDDNNGTVITFRVVAPANTAPVITQGDSVTVNMSEDGAPNAFSLTLNATDAQNNTLTWSISTPATHGTASASGTGTSKAIGYSPASNYNGNDSFVVHVSDGNGGVDTITVNVVIAAVNDQPTFTAVNPTAVNEDSGAQTVSSWASFQAGGGTDENSQTAMYVVTSVGNPSLFSGVGPTVSSNGTLTFTPAPNAFGTSTFDVYVEDSGGTANGGDDTSPTQQFTITVNPVNDAPSFTSGGNVTVNEDTAYNAAWATAISAGPNESGQALTFSVTNSNNALFSVQPAIASNGTLTFTPTANAFGTATVTVSLSDNGGTANGGVNTAPSQQFTITVNSVNDAPSFSSGGDVTVNEDSGGYGAAWATAISSGPANESGQTLTFNVSNDNTALFSVQPTIASGGALSFTPAANAFGVAIVTVTLSDSGGSANGGLDTSAPQTFRITVNGVNDAPSFTGGGAVTVNEDSAAYSATWATAISAGPNEGGQTLTFTVTNNTNTALFSAQPAIASDGTLTFTPAANAFGTADVTVRLSDNGGTAHGGVDTSATATFTITVNSANDAPSFTSGGDVTVNEDSGGYGAVWATAISAGPANESGQTLTFNVTNNTNSSLFSVQPAIASTGALTFTPAADAFGTAMVTVSLSDNGGTANAGIDTSAPVTFTITVTGVNDAPSFTSGGAVTVNEDSGTYNNAWATAVSAGPNEGGQTLTFTVTNDNNALFSGQPAIAADGTLTFTLAANAFGTAQVTVTLSDDGGTANGGVNTSPSQQFTITVNAVNDAPSFTSGGNVTVNEDSGGYGAAWATAISAGPANESGQTLTFNVSTDNTALFSVQPTIASGGALSFTPAADAFGTAMVTVTLSDNGGTAHGGIDTSAAQTFTITVNGVNDAPTFTSGAAVTVNEDSAAYSAAWATAVSAGPNEGGQTLTFAVTNNTNTALFSVQPAIAPNGTLTFTPAANAFGEAEVTVRLSDNGGIENGGVDTSAPATFTITVSSVNDAPTFTASALTPVNEDASAQTIAGWVTSFNPGGGTFESGQSVLAYHVNGVTPGMFTAGPAVSTNGTLTYTLAPNANGTASFTVRVQDNGGTANGGIDMSAPQTFTLNVNAVNDEPSFIGSNQTVAEDAGAQSVASWASFNPGGGPDEGTQTATYTVGVVSNPGLFAVGAGPAVSPTGTLTYTPAANAFGYSTFQVTVQDSGGTLNSGDDTSATLTYTITVTGVNDAPANLSFSAAPVSISEGASTSLTGSFTDVEGTDTHTVVINWGDGTLNTSISLAAGVLSIPATAHTYADDTPTNTAFDAYTITVTVTDSGTTQTPPYPIPVGTTTGVTVTNVTPTLSITSPADGALYPLGTPVTLTVPITDPGADTFTCSINWDDPASPAVETSSSTTKNCNKAHSFAQAGVYTIVITVNDDDQPGVTDTKTIMVIVYDPSAGFVTGGGTIWSPLGAFVPDPTLQGKANFGFVSKYQKGAKTPSGQTEFQFHAGNLNFHGDVYQWLVVSGAKAQYKGTGTLNNVPGYGFLLTATDGQLSGGGGVDRFRIKITTAGGVVVYDNNPGPGDDPDTNPGQNIQTGSIVIHAK